MFIQTAFIKVNNRVVMSELIKLINNTRHMNFLFLQPKTITKVKPRPTRYISKTSIKQIYHVHFGEKYKSTIYHKSHRIYTIDIITYFLKILLY